MKLGGVLRFYAFGILGAIGFVLVALVTFAVQVSYLEPLAGYRAFAAAAGRAAPWVVGAGALVLLVDLVFLVTSTLLRGRADRSAGKVVSAGPLPTGLGIRMGRSKRKILAAKSQWVTVESLVDGTATLQDRLFAAGIVLLFVSFYSIFLGAGLFLLERWFVGGIAFVAVPGLWVIRAMIAPAWADYRRVKAKLRGA